VLDRQSSPGLKPTFFLADLHPAEAGYPHVSPLLVLMLTATEFMGMTRQAGRLSHKHLQTGFGTPVAQTLAKGFRRDACRQSQREVA
jgi:hypothetical protein